LPYFDLVVVVSDGRVGSVDGVEVVEVVQVVVVAAAAAVVVVVVIVIVDDDIEVVVPFSEASRTRIDLTAANLFLVISCCDFSNNSLSSSLSIISDIFYNNYTQLTSYLSCENRKPVINKVLTTSHNLGLKQGFK